jgi:hypothetical protein
LRGFSAGSQSCKDYESREYFDKISGGHIVLKFKFLAKVTGIMSLKCTENFQNYHLRSPRSSKGGGDRTPLVREEGEG